MSNWFLDPVCKTKGVEEVFGSLDAVFNLQGELIAKDPLSCVLRVSIDGKR